MFGLKQIINNYTGISEPTSTTIVLILISDPGKVSQSGIVDCCVSDHMMIYCTRKTSREFMGKHNIVTLRSLKNYSNESFQQSLLGSGWTSVLTSDHVNDAWNNFKFILFLFLV